MSRMWRGQREPRDVSNGTFYARRQRQGSMIVAFASEQDTMNECCALLSSKRSCHTPRCCVFREQERSGEQRTIRDSSVFKPAPVCCFGGRFLQKNRLDALPALDCPLFLFVAHQDAAGRVFAQALLPRLATILVVGAPEQVDKVVRDKRIQQGLSIHWIFPQRQSSRNVGTRRQRLSSSLSTV